ncbi:YktB family protein [Psychrobacillus psychrodurans]|uniref:YktB family protein n=1 Tax=Psychrobacillus psychrodurans TaxID=126157 RepID=UPI003D02F0AF
MSKTFWTVEDFDVFQIDGLENRMAGLIEKIRPKFEELGGHYSHYFSTILGQEYYPHVAKHARRSVNPPKDSWVAFAPYKRGYKALPHFQIGLWGRHAFIILAVIYEAPDKVAIAERLLKKKGLFNKLPADFIVSGDHMKPEASLLKKEKKDGLEQLLVRLKDVKKAEFLVGRHISREEAVKLTEEEFLELAEETFDHLLPIYKTMVHMK